jgi:hypothetical protein
VYLILSNPPFEYGTRHALTNWWIELSTLKHLRWMAIPPFWRKLVLASAIYIVCGGIAIWIPGKSGKVCK